MRGGNVWVGGFETRDLFWHVVDPDHAKSVFLKFWYYCNQAVY